jgi:hypothetical protein
MTEYWKVHISNFNYFISYILNKYKYFVDRGGDDTTHNLYSFKQYYRHSEDNYLYLCIDVSEIFDNRYVLTYCRSSEWLEEHDCHNNGTFTDRLEKLKRLDKISKLN